MLRPVRAAKKLLSRESLLALLSQAGCSDQVKSHCKAVSEIATKMAIEAQRRGAQVDVELVSAGALLHDIGRSRSHGINHALIGARIAEEAGLSKSIIGIIERHIGAGITAEEAFQLGLPKRNYLPQTLEEKIVSYADRLIENDKAVSPELALEHFSDELGASHPAVERFRLLLEELLPIVGENPRCL